MQLSKKQWFILILLVIGFIAAGGVIGFVFASLHFISKTSTLHVLGQGVHIRFLGVSSYPFEVWD
jgi:hypothetical protein